MKKKLSLILFILSVGGVIWFSSTGETAELEGILLYLPFDEGSGDKAKDLSGNSFDGELNEAKWSDGKFGKALKFDGKSSFVAVEPIGVDPDEITIEFWFSPAKDLDSSDPRMDMVYALNGCCRPHVTFNRAQEVLPGAVGFYLEFGNEAPDAGPALAIGTKKTSWDANTWYHLAATADEKETKVYLDGELEDEKKSLGPVRYTYNEHGISIGAGLGGSGNFFNGRMDEFRIWERVLSADEVKKAFDGTLMAIEKKDKLAITWGSIKDMR